MSIGDYDRRRAEELDARRELLDRIGAEVCEVCSAIILNAYQHAVWHNGIESSDG